MKPATVSKEYNLGNIVLMNIKYIPHVVLSFRVVVSNRHGYPDYKWTPPHLIVGYKDENKGSERSPSESQLHLDYEMSNSEYPRSSKRKYLYPRPPLSCPGPKQVFV